MHPCSTGLAITSQQGELLALLSDIKQFDIQNLSLDLPQDIRARIERALVEWIIAHGSAKYGDGDE